MSRHSPSGRLNASQGSMNVVRQSAENRLQIANQKQLNALNNINIDSNELIDVSGGVVTPGAAIKAMPLTTKGDATQTSQVDELNDEATAVS